LAERDLAARNASAARPLRSKRGDWRTRNHKRRVAAETQASFLCDARKQMEKAFAATAQKR